MFGINLNGVEMTRKVKRILNTISNNLRLLVDLIIMLLIGFLIYNLHNNPQIIDHTALPTVSTPEAIEGVQDSDDLCLIHETKEECVDRLLLEE